MCAVHTRQAPDTPCAECGSENHGTGAHEKLEKAYKRLGIGLTTLAYQTEIDLAGTPGQPSLSGRDSAPPDHLRIVPCIISAPGTSRPFRGAAILRLWRPDPEGGCTFMLSLDQFDHPYVRSFLDALFGGAGFVVLAEFGSTPLTLDVGRHGTFVSI